MVKIIFHVLLLVLEAIERRKWNKVTTLFLNSFPLEAWWDILAIEDQGAAIYGSLVQRGSDKKFLFKKYLSYFDSAKIEVAKMIFHVLFLLVETIERRK